MAAKIPMDKYFVSANQGLLVDYIADHSDFMASAGLVEFANKHQLPTGMDITTYVYWRPNN